jgi:hypothetical protein
MCVKIIFAKVDCVCDLDACVNSVVHELCVLQNFRRSRLYL